MEDSILARDLLVYGNRDARNRMWSRLFVAGSFCTKIIYRTREIPEANLFRDKVVLTADGKAYVM